MFQVSKCLWVYSFPNLGNLGKIKTNLSDINNVNWFKDKDKKYFNAQTSNAA